MIGIGMTTGALGGSIPPTPTPIIPSGCGMPGVIIAPTPPIAAGGIDDDDDDDGNSS